jgi:hypothetical protein
MPCSSVEVLPNYTLLQPRIVLYTVTAVGTSSTTYDKFTSQLSLYIYIRKASLGSILRLSHEMCFMFPTFSFLRYLHIFCNVY